MKKYVIKLSVDEQEQLKKILSNGRSAAKNHRTSKVLMLADVNNKETPGGHTDEEIYELTEVSLRTIGRIRKQFVEEGFDAPFKRKSFTRYKDRTFGGEEEAKLIALCCGNPPEGYARWSLRLLAETVVELKIVPTVCHETIRQTLKKTNLSLG